ncbi:MAG: FtsX-like permease family protein, partial [Saprospiraceae bacterium]|nr:FtsX-like permease family protein [Saprospiraceae bacterium]
GATAHSVRNVFLYEGFLLCVLGLAIGFVIAIGVFIIHVYSDRGLVPLPPNFATDRYPVALKSIDFGIVSLTVIVIGLLASVPAALRAMRVETSIQEE